MSRWVSYATCVTGLLLLASFTAEGQSGDGVVRIENGKVRYSITVRDGKAREEYFVRRMKGWQPILEAGTVRPELEMRCEGVAPLSSFAAATVENRQGKQVVRLSAVARWGKVEKIVALVGDESRVDVDVTCRIDSSVRLERLASTYAFVPGGQRYSSYKPLDFVYTPQLRPEPEQVIADHVMRSPALIFQEGPYCAILVPAPEGMDGAQRRMRSTADLQVTTSDAPFFSFGLQNWMPEPYQLRNTHVFYAAPDSLAPVLKDTTVAFRYVLLLDGDAAPRQGYQRVTHFLWDRYGKQAFASPTGPQTEPFSAYIHKAWYEFLLSIALDTVEQGRPVTLLRQGRLAWSNGLHPAADNDCWFNVWFNALRTAYGMYLYGQNAHDTALTARAERVLNLALLAPRHDGIAPTIFYVDSAGGHWVADHAWGGINHGEDLAMFHNAWTGYWLLQWMDLAPSRSGEIRKATDALGQFLVHHQLPSGVIPSWYDPVTLQAVPVLRDENAETAGAALFLAELYQRSHQHVYLAAAEKAMAYIFAAVLPERKWFDFETFFSCSRKPIGFFDRYTQQQPQNTLSMHQAAEACNVLYRITGKRIYREQGTAILDYLCLFQQVWSPRWLSRELFGGFGVQNTDAEWSDARQGYFAVTLMNYYDLTGNSEYFERGVAALRAMFSLFESPTSPRTAENYAHAGRDVPAGVTGIHWGTGSSVVSIHLIHERYGDARVDAQKQWGAGIDGCRVTDVTAHGDSIAFTLRDVVNSPRTLTVTFAGVTHPRYTIVVNGKKLGSFTRNSLRKGIAIAV